MGIVGTGREPKATWTDRRPLAQQNIWSLWSLVSGKPIILAFLTSTRAGNRSAGTEVFMVLLRRSDKLLGPYPERKPCSPPC